MPNRLPRYPLSVNSDEDVENSQAGFSTHRPIANCIGKFEGERVQAEGRQSRHGVQKAADCEVLHMMKSIRAVALPLNYHSHARKMQF